MTAQMTDTRRDALSEAKRALLEKRLRGDAPQANAIPHRSDDEPAPLSFAQERLWFLHQLDPASAAYNMHEAYRVREPLDIAALGRALNVLIARHEALRTSFVEINGQPIQRIASSAALTVQRVDRQDDDIQQFAADAARHSFDLSRAPLVHVAVAVLADDDHVLTLTLHHIISDEWSNGVLWRELSQLYADEMHSTQTRLAVLPIQYADYAAWQRSKLSAVALQTSLAFWKNALSGDLPLLQLPLDHPRPPVQRHRGAICARTIGLDVATTVRQAALRANTTSFTVLLTAYIALLHRYTGQDDLLVGVPVANRNRAETEGVVGFFLNNLYNCVQGAIGHCAVYAGEKRCATCEDKFLAIQAESSRVINSLSLADFMIRACPVNRWRTRPQKMFCS